MKRLLILRHAQALSTDPGGTDKSRRLSPNGIADAKALGGLLIKEGFQPDHILCSPAVRTSETLRHVLEAFDADGAARSVDFPEEFYNGAVSQYLEAIQHTDNQYETVLLVGHNPGIHMLAAQLASDNASAFGDRLSAGYAPATLSVLECDIEIWSDIELYENRVTGIFEPLDYNAPSRPTRWM